MRYFIITSGPWAGEKFTVPDEATEADIESQVQEITCDRGESYDTEEITAEQYADEFEGEE